MNPSQSLIDQLLSQYAGSCNHQKMPYSQRSGSSSLNPILIDRGSMIGNTGNTRFIGRDEPGVLSQDICSQEPGIMAFGQSRIHDPHVSTAGARSDEPKDGKQAKHSLFTPTSSGQSVSRTVSNNIRSLRHKLNTYDNGRDYEEGMKQPVPDVYHITESDCPSLHQPPVKNNGGDHLISVQRIPGQFRSIFKQFSHFNHVQSAAFDDLLLADQPVVVSAPTGSGKTVLFELAIVRLLCKQQNYEDVKVVYIGPIKALCNERMADWSVKFSPLGLRVVEVTGDSQGDDLESIRDNNLIITTPEKWDALSRKMRYDRNILTSIKLVLIDEVHLLNDDDRGHVLEAVVSRIKTNHCEVRFVAASATFPNVEDVAFWLGGIEAVFFKFSESERPIQLERVVVGFPFYQGQSEFRFEMNLSYRLEKVIHNYSQGSPTLIFCITRKSTVYTCSVLGKFLKSTSLSRDQRGRMISQANLLSDTKLQTFVIDHGVGYHHAGVELGDRRLLEQLFINGLLPILCCTTTLAMGVNLPAQLVVIKGTKQMVGGGWREYSESQVLQMAGRAGRPQFCNSATVVIMTEQSKIQFYENLIGGSQTVESNLGKHLMEHLNAEVVLGTIGSVEQAVDWLKSTYLVTRVKKEPTKYGYPAGISSDQLDKMLGDLCLQSLQEMAKQEVGLINLSDSGIVKSTHTGRLMSRFYLNFMTMKNLKEVTDSATLSDLLNTICMSKEFNEVVLRVNERKTLNNLNKNKEKNTIKYPVSDKVKTSDMKVNVLLQAHLGSMMIQEPGLNLEASRLLRLAQRISSCLVELIQNDQDKKYNFNLVSNSILLKRCLNTGLWEDSIYIVRQMDKVGLVISNNLVNAGYTNFLRLGTANPRNIELVAGKAPPFGNHVRDFGQQMAVYQLKARQVAVNKVEVEVNIENKEAVTRRRTDHDWVILLGTGSNHLVSISYGSDSLLLSQDFRLSLFITKDWSTRMTIILINQNISGLDRSSSLDLRLPFNQQPVVTNIYVPQTENTGCKHTCNNKSSCGHICCKNGTKQTKRSEFLDKMQLIRSSFKNKFPISKFGMVDDCEAHFDIMPMNETFTDSY